ncbi:MAG: hypothetical protein ABIJ18_00940 [archaeon]
MLLTISEIFSLLILTLTLGYIFTGYIKRDPYQIGFSWKDLQFAAIIAAPAVILHELGHKFIAILLGHTATFFIYWWGLGLAVILKLLSSPLLILAPAYVSIPTGIPPLHGFLIAFAGPGTNLLLFLISFLVLKYKKNLKINAIIGWTISQKLNLFLFIFNIIPIPPLDGYHLFSNLIQLF